MTYDIKPKVKPKWYEFRWKLSNYLVSIAKFIYPESPEVKAFFMKLCVDSAICGKSIVRVNPKDTLML